jgi:membrane protease YdiL (CAAX protease family)
VLGALLFGGEWLAQRGANALWRYIPRSQQGQLGSFPFYALCLMQLLLVSGVAPRITRTAWWPKRWDAWGALALVVALMLGPLGASWLGWAPAPHWHWPTWPVAFLTGGVLDPLVEEWIFRGALWRGAEWAVGPSKWAPAIAGAFTSLLFGLWHVPFQQTPFSQSTIPVVLVNAAFGAGLAVARWRFGGIGPGTIIHALGNSYYLLTGQIP